MGIGINKTKKALLIAALVVGGTIATNAQVTVVVGGAEVGNDFSDTSIPEFTFDFSGKGISGIASMELNLTMSYTDTNSQGSGPSNLSASLQSPNGTSVAVFATLTGNNQTTVNFTGTAKFLDNGIELPANNATYDGSYAPSSLFSGFNSLSSENINGTWKLLLADSAAIGLDNGNVNSATSLTITAVPEPSAYAAMMGLGMLGFAAFRRFRAQSAA